MTFQTRPVAFVLFGLVAILWLASLAIGPSAPEPESQAHGASETQLSSAEMTDTDRTALREEIRAYLLENPEVLMEAIAVLEQRQAQQQASNDGNLVEQYADAIYDDGFSYVGGNPEGDITVVEFLDYRCSFCRRAHPEVTELISSDGNIKYIIKEFPILGEQSTLSSQFAIAVRHIEGPEAYKAVSDALMTFRGQVTKDALERLAADQNLDGEAILEKMDSPEVAQEIAATRALAQRLRITGTPTFVMAGELVRGYIPLETMRTIVARGRDES